MPTVTQRKPRSKVSRTVKLLLPIGLDGGSGVIRIKVVRGTKETVNDYLIQRIPSDFGDGFQMDKLLGDEMYHVHLSNEGHQCECLGHLRWGHCKHVDALVALRGADLI